MDQLQRQIDRSNADARSAGVRFEVIRPLGIGALVVAGVLLISGLISVLGIKIPRPAAAAT